MITNTSDHEAVGVTFEGTAEWNYHIGVTDDKGIPPQSTEYGLRTRGYPQGSRAFVRLQPKESRDETFLLNKLFVLVPGKTYHVQVQRNDRYNATPTLTAKSNIFTISIAQ